ncbi:MAG: hypothetical protein LBO63_00005 [Oscillospiraceae bacterium]|nr:hypothetical protein [Oscillospiraceae bacterium]
MFEIGAKLGSLALQSACAAGGYFFQGFAFVGDDVLIVPCCGCRDFFWRT